MPRSLPLSWTTALVLLLPVAAWSQEAGQDAPTEQADAALTVSSDLRADYIQGEPIPVRLRVENPSGADASFPALDLRPHLVVTPKGDKQTWFNTPPAEDGDQRWTVRAGSHREVLLQVPSSQRFLAGDYRVTVRILDGEVEHELPEHRFTLAKADPAAGRAFSEPVGVERAGYHAAWVQRTGTGYELYLNVTDGKDPGKFVAEWSTRCSPTPCPRTASTGTSTGSMVTAPSGGCACAVTWHERSPRPSSRPTRRSSCSAGAGPTPRVACTYRSGFPPPRAAPARSG
jgi:hypothetical protein